MKKCLLVLLVLGAVGVVAWKLLTAEVPADGV